MKTLIVPGWYGSGAGHWQSWWLETDKDARLVEQEDWANPSLEAWLPAAIRAVEAEPDSVLVAHSLGSALVAHLALRRPDLPIAGALLVSPADVDDASWTSPQLASFGPMPARRLPFPAIVVASRTDPFVTFGRALWFAKDWGAEVVDAGNAGHINVDSGFGPWPEGKRLARRLAETARERRAGETPRRLAWPFAQRQPVRQKGRPARQPQRLG